MVGLHNCAHGIAVSFVFIKVLAVALVTHATFIFSCYNLDETPKLVSFARVPSSA